MKRQLAPTGRRYPCGDCDDIGRKDDVRGMIGNKVLGLAAVFVLLLVIAAPVTAAEKTIQLNSPGCNA
jgi:hypothetical protein